MNFNQFFKELKRRSVYKVAVTYAIVAWFLLQLVSTISPMINVPDSIGKTVLILLIVGFPLALIVAWAFEMSPEGMIRTTSEAASENPLPDHKRKPLTSNLLIGVLLMIIAGQFIYNKYFDSGKDVANIEKSIAVLPFRQ